jgi:D-beta-D-heptose 7-phosphate kinase/D-beta-D-heptose 1-phosphate adenosyltransferase
VEAALPTCHAVILQDYHKGFFDQGLFRSVIEAAHKAGRKVLVDPHRATPVSHYRGADVLTPNRKEAEALAGVPAEKAGTKLQELTGASHVVVTLGKDGMAVTSAGKKAAKMIPTVAREVYDVSGAGDTVIAVLALALSSGVDIEVGSQLANTAAGIEVGKVGTATVEPGEILRFLRA